MRSSFARRSFLGAALLAASCLAACGGSGGGGGTGLPGTLAALAVEGDPTPAGGTYGPFPHDVLLAAADGGWVAFVADIVGGPDPRALFVARPNGSVVVVWSHGDTVPATNGATGTIDDFERIWMRPDGVVVAHVEIAGGSGEGILTARVDSGGVVGSRATAVHLGRPLPPSTWVGAPAPGTLTVIDEELTEVSVQGNVYFAGTGSGMFALRGIWAAPRDGGPLLPVAVTGDPVSVTPTPTLGLDFSGIGIDESGVLVAFACSVTGGPAEALYVTAGNGFAEVAHDGTVPPSAGGRSLDDTHEGGPIVVGFNGTNAGVVTWLGSLSGAAPDNGIFTRTVTVAGGGGLTLGALNDVTLPGDTVAGTSNGLNFDCRILPGQDDPSRWPIEILVAGGSTDRVLLSVPNKDTLTEVFRQGTPAPGSSSAFANTYPSLSLEENDAQSRDGSFAFTAVLADGSSGVWWPVFGSSLFLVAREGEPAPGTGGGAFASFATASSVSVALEVVAFQAAIVGGTTASGIFRQG